MTLAELRAKVSLLRTINDEISRTSQTQPQAERAGARAEAYAIVLELIDKERQGQ